MDQLKLSNNKYTPKESWVVTNTGSGAEIVHAETGLKFKLNRDGLSFVDDNNFKINGKQINYESVYTPVYKDNFPPDQPEGKGPTEKDLYKNNPDRADIISDIEVKNQVDAPSNVQKYSLKGLDFLGKAVAPIDEALELGIPKLLANTAAAPFAQSLVKVFRQLTLVNLGIAATKGLYASETMGENWQNLLKDPDNPEYIAERQRLTQEGLQAFSDHMSTYDPSIRFIDKVTEEKFGFNQSDAAIKVYGGVKNLFRGGRKWTKVQ